MGCAGMSASPTVHMRQVVRKAAVNTAAIVPWESRCDPVLVTCTLDS